MFWLFGQILGVWLALISLWLFWKMLCGAFRLLESAAGKALAAIDAYIEGTSSPTKRPAYLDLPSSSTPTCSLSVSISSLQNQKRDAEISRLIKGLRR
jgi:hypothetical protein